MALTQIDRELIDQCLQRRPTAWQAFVDRFSGLLIHVIRHTSESRSQPLNQSDQDDVAAEILAELLANDMRILRNFRGKSSLAAYLTVVARRITVQCLIERRKQELAKKPLPETAAVNGQPGELALENRELVERLMSKLSRDEARIVKAYHLEGKSYREISSQYNIPENSIGPVLTRARDHMRKLGSPAPQ